MVVGKERVVESVVVECKVCVRKRQAKGAGSANGSARQLFPLLPPATTLLTVKDV